MVGEEDRGVLLRSLRGYLVDLLESGVDELPYGTPPDPVRAVEPHRVPKQAGEGTQAGLPRPVPDPPRAEGAGKAAPPAYSCRVQGDPAARLLFVLAGEGFAGQAGALLEKIVRAMGFPPEAVRLVTGPFGTGEADGWRASVLAEIASVKPEVVVALGEESVALLNPGEGTLTQLRGKFHECHGFPLMPSYHPEALLADEGLKRDVWNDMKQVMARLKQGR